MSETVLLPPNSTIWERAVTDALGFELDAEILIQIKDPATCPAALLPYLAAEEGVDQWSSTWPEVVKRAAISVSWEAHRRKGTPQAMDNAVATLGLDWSWQEWFQYGGQPYRFRLIYKTPSTGLSWATLIRARDHVNRAKNVRSIMEFVAETETPTPVYVGCFGIVFLNLGDITPAPHNVEIVVGVFGINSTSIGDA